MAKKIKIMRVVFYCVHLHVNNTKQLDFLKICKNWDGAGQNGNFGPLHPNFYKFSKNPIVLCYLLVSEHNKILLA